MLASVDNERCAVFILQNGAIVRQTRYSEFEALLDQVGTLPELSGNCAKAVYVEIDSQLAIAAAVFFQLSVDARGYADPEWNIPLSLLASQALPGPDLGAGPIRLATRSRCTVSWHQDQLWDPPLASDGPFQELCQAVRDNRLGLSTAQPESSIPTLSEQHLQNTPGKPTGVNAEERARVARRLWASRAKYRQLQAQQQQEMVQVHKRHRMQVQQLEGSTADLLRKITEEQHISAQLKQSLDAQAGHFGKMRQLISSQISKIEDGERLGEQLGDEFNVKLDAATAELQEALERKDVELFYRDGEIKCLGQTIAELQQQKAELEQRLAGGEFLGQMSAAGIRYVAQQPGAGEFQVPIEDIPTYLESPEDYAARYCYVDLELYRSWLAHHDRPVCSFQGDDSRVCAMPVHRIASPATFEPGEHDRCSQHKSSNMTLHQVIRTNGG